MTTTDQKVTEAADRVRAAVASFNAAAEEAVRLGLMVNLDRDLQHGRLQVRRGARVNRGRVNS